MQYYTPERKERAVPFPLLDNQHLWTETKHALHLHTTRCACSSWRLAQILAWRKPEYDYHESTVT